MRSRRPSLRQRLRFDAEGAEIYLKPAGSYVHGGRSVTFATIVAAARRRGEVAIGYRDESLAQDPDANYGVVVNPPKQRTFTPGPADRVIVVAED